MQAIKTVYLGPTDSRGSRIKATCEGGSVTVPYPHELNQGADAHSVAALALGRKLGWHGRLAAVALRDCYVFVFCSEGEYEIDGGPIAIRE
jgi:hypothetical protein